MSDAPLSTDKLRRIDGNNDGQIEALDISRAARNDTLSQSDLVDVQLWWEGGGGSYDLSSAPDDSNPSDPVDSDPSGPSAPTGDPGNESGGDPATGGPSPPTGDPGGSGGSSGLGRQALLGLGAAAVVVAGVVLRE